MTTSKRGDMGFIPDSLLLAYFIREITLSPGPFKF
jgi:hypothetical protein